ncbi:hypothetical protein EVAR_102568_1 [Eumeta japonica]|uniref:Uncharacterized protein n=1 Tax=Eumeta variegata TaxID=151549 RepID=A0A4C1SR13_EUMVA|nr:hypothetical protein EVAR_102568_1 [Eumeta japonica]
MATPPQLKCMQLMCNGCTNYKMQGVVHPQLLANRHLVKLGLIKKSERKRCPSFDRRHTARNPPTIERSVRIVKRGNWDFKDNEHANHQRIGDHRRQWRLSDSEELLRPEVGHQKSLNNSGKLTLHACMLEINKAITIKGGGEHELSLKTRLIGPQSGRLKFGAEDGTRSTAAAAAPAGVLLLY